MSKIKSAPSVVTWRAWSDADLAGRAVRECSTPGCKKSVTSLRMTAIQRPTGSALVRKHAFCDEHTPDGVI